MKTELKDTVQATEGSAYITIDGKTREFAEIGKVSATVELKVKEKRLMGHRMSQHKIVGAVGKGSVTIHFMTGTFNGIALNYIKKGVYPNISLQFTNNDPQSRVGTNDVILKNVVFAKSLLTALEEDTEDDITFDSDFTFDDADGISFFDEEIK